MMSAAMSRHGGGERGQYAHHRGGGMVILVSAVLAVPGFFPCDSRENLATRRAVQRPVLTL